MSDETPVDVALAQAVIDNFHCPDDKHSSWWLNTDELRHAFVPILSAHDESVRAEARDGGIDDANMAWQMTLLAHTDLTPEDVGTVLAHLSDGFRRVRAIDAARIAREGA